MSSAEPQRPSEATHAGQISDRPGSAAPDPATAAPPGTVRGEDGLLRPVWAAHEPLMRAYYDTEWGVPVSDEAALFERLSLEAFQSGLSWATILRKRPAFRVAFAQFSPDAVASFGDADLERLLADAGIVRNRAKILATIGNARATVALRAEGGLAQLLWSFAPGDALPARTPAEIPSTSSESVALSRALKRRGFAFVGPTTAYSLMQAIGIVNGHLLSSHRFVSSGAGQRPGALPA